MSGTTHALLKQQRWVAKLVTDSIIDNHRSIGYERLLGGWSVPISR